MLKQPCKDCPDRHLACHDTCEKYQEYRKEKDKDKQLYIKGRELEKAYWDVRKGKRRKR